MCLAVPMRVKEIKGETAVVEYGGVEYEANVTLLESVSSGEYLIVHAGFAIQKLDEKEALETLKIFEELERASAPGKQAGG
jgi:hydrogenase expression/formation protein HypC